MKGHVAGNLKGIDVSHWNGKIDWPEVKNQGIHFVFIKATEGTTFIDPMFGENYEGAVNAGLSVGAYHFARFKNLEEAESEARFFLQVTKGKVFSLPLVLDLEVNNGMNKEICTEAAAAFLREIDGDSRKPLLYSNPSFIQRYLKPVLGEYPLWLAHYNTQKPKSVEGWESWTIWQYRSDGKIEGINGNVDLNEMTHNQQKNTYYKIETGDTLSGIAQQFHCTVEALMTQNQLRDPDHILAGQVIEIPISEKGEAELYTVKAGDTLSEIAESHGVSIKSIVKLNQIRNINLIYEGQHLKLR